ncbi:LTA synthase family protein [Deferribacterales bacterium RsTz2092]|nr:sulfatase [Deferribacterales bacterium]
MPKNKFLTDNCLIYLKFMGFIWLIELIMRAIFALWQWSALSANPAGVIAKAFYIGIRFDGRLACLLALPVLFVLYVPILNKRFDVISIYLRHFYMGLIFILLVVYAADFAHYSYIGVRINFELFHQLNDLKESILMVWQTYHVLPLLVFMALAVYGAGRIIKIIFDKCFYAREYPLKMQIISGIFAFIISFILIYGQYSFTWFPLRWSEAYFAGKREISALGLNPVQNIYDTKPRKKRKNRQDIKLVQSAYPLVADYLGIKGNLDLKGDTPLDYMRLVPETGRTRPNIVLIIVESLSTHKTSLMFDELPVTPFLKQLAEKSLYFPNYYASARTTARALFSIFTGIPDKNPSFDSSSRDADAVDQHLIWTDFKDYKKLFMLGGNANWANMRGVLANNISGLEILEEGFWKAKRVDTWGISDIALMRESNAYLASLDKSEPFFAVLLTAANHRPFTIPKNIDGFDYSEPKTSFVEKYGFYMEEYNGMRLCDFALKEFFELAEKSDYYDNTIFIVVGDHGIMESSPAAPKTYQKLELHEYQVPLVIHYPKRFKSGVVLQAGGHTDLFPTIAGLVGISYHNTTLGRDLFDKRYGDDRWTFIMRTYTTPLLVSRDRLAVGGTGEIYSRKKDDMHSDWQLVEPEPADAKALELLTTGIEETARYMLYHNKKTGE